jgi:chromosome segregation ATPase
VDRANLVGPWLPPVVDSRTHGRIFYMSKRFTEEKFQQFASEQLKKISSQVTAVQDDVAEVRTDQQALRKRVVNVADVHRELRTEIILLRGEISEIKEELRPIANAVDRDAVKIVQHERRIKILERHNGSPAR